MRNEDQIVLQLEQENQEGTRGFLAWIEKVGNKMPHPLAMFL